MNAFLFPLYGVLDWVWWDFFRRSGMIALVLIGVVLGTERVVVYAVMI